MKGMAESAGEQRPHRLRRWGMRRVVLASIAMVCTMLTLAVSTDLPSLFLVNFAPDIIHLDISSSLPPLLSSPPSLTSSLSSPPSLASSSSLAPALLASSPSMPASPMASLPSSLIRSGSIPIRMSSLTGAPLAAPGCDYTIGKWVKDENGPLYSGKRCKRWLSGMWACRLMPSRTNFNYESYRWQPDGCNLPKFNSQNFLARMQNKVVAIVGDSIGRQQYQSLMCMLTGGDDAVSIQDISKRYGLVKPRGSIRADGTAHRFIKTNTTIIFYWSASLCEIEPLDKLDRNTKYAMHLDRPVTFLQKYVKLMDVLVLNTGHHWNRGKLEVNKWVMYVNGKPNTNRKFERNVPSARVLAIQSVAAWLDKQRKMNKTRAEIYIRSLSPRHFFHGEWDSGGRCDDDFVPANQTKATGRPASDPVVESAILGTNLHLLNVTYVSQFRYDAHISKYRPHQSGQDCLHWCLPGVPDVWNELLYADIFSRENASRDQA